VGTVSSDEQRPPKRRDTSRSPAHAKAPAPRSRPASKPIARSSTTRPNVRPVARPSASSPVRPTKPQVSRRRFWARRAGILGALLTVILLIGGVGYYLYLGFLVNHTEVNGLQASGGPENILLVGSTDRCALAHQNAAYGLCSAGVTGINADITMIAHLDPAKGTISLLSLPRDVFIPNARKEGANKIDAALYQGPGQLVNAIQEDFGIPINHFVELNFETFAKVVDALGGVNMWFSQPIFDQEAGLNIHHRGCYHLDGFHALQVVRARHLQIQPAGGSTVHATWPQEAQSDLARIRRTHEFLRVMGAKLAATGISNPATDVALAQAVVPNLKVDQSFSENHMLSLAATFASVSIGAVPQLTYPILVSYAGGYHYEGGNYGDVVLPVQPGGSATIAKVLGLTDLESTWDGAALPQPGAVKVSIQNGSGTVGQAGVVADAMRTRGFIVTGTGNRVPTGPLGETIVWYGGPPPPKSGNWVNPALAKAERVMHELHGIVVMGYDPARVDQGADVTVVTGQDLDLAPVAPPTAVKKSTTTTMQIHAPTTVLDPAAVAKDPRLSAPSATAEPLKPWDPTGCNAQGNGPST
jgi:LCP family protein required for cell wall assembly